jgi:hypothetical protein
VNESERLQLMFLCIQCYFKFHSVCFWHWQEKTEKESCIR